MGSKIDYMWNTDVRLDLFEVFKKHFKTEF